MNLTAEIIYLILSYLLGALPFGYILTRKATGKNIMEFGSGNVGSTNVGRVAGRKTALYTQILDMLKGMLPVAVLLLAAQQAWFTYREGYIYAVALASILGHDFSVFLWFRGGKGVNTTLGASVLITPIPVLAAVIVYLIVKKIFRYVSAGSIALAITLPLTEALVNGFSQAFYYLLLSALLILLRHHSNIRRLLKGNENL